MKKIFITFSLMLLSFAWTAQAQKDVTVRFGGVAGFNMSQWGGDFADYFGASFKPGFHVGGVAEMIVNQKVSIQPELLFAAQGTNSDVFGGVDAMYVKIPLVIYYNFSIAKGAGRLSPGVGFYCSEGLIGKFDGNKYGWGFINPAKVVSIDPETGEKKNPPFSGDQNTFDHMGRFDFGFEARVNYTMEKGATKGLYAGLCFSQGFGQARPMVVGLSVGYKFKENEWLGSTYYKNKRTGSTDKRYQD